MISLRKNVTVITCPRLTATLTHILVRLRCLIKMINMLKVVED